MNRSTLLRWLPLSILLLASCRSVGLTESGSLSSYQNLAVDGDQRARKSFIAPETRWQAYDAIVLEPLALDLQPSSLDQVSEANFDRLTSHYDGFLRESLTPRWQVLDVPRPGALIVRSTLTEIDTINVPLNWITGLGLLWPVDVGGATVELEILDATTGEQLAALINADKATLLNGIQAMIAIGHACQSVEESANWVGAVVGD